MDRWNTNLDLHHQHMPNSHSQQRETAEIETKDTSDARKVQKADREKLRRDKMNEQFIELGNIVDPERPKHDKASIIIDTIQVLKNLTTEVNRLKAECAALSEESCELTQEKNELREEKSSLKSDIETLKAQHQQRGGVMFPWGGIDPSSSVVMPPPYSFPVTLPVPSLPLPIHPFPFFTNHNPPVPVSSPTFMPYPCSSSKQECRRKSLDRFSNSNDENGENCSDVVTELELKTPGSRSGQELLAGDKRGKHAEKKGQRVGDGGCSSSRYTSSRSFQDSSSNSVVDNK